MGGGWAWVLVGFHPTRTLCNSKAFPEVQFQLFCYRIFISIIASYKFPLPEDRCGSSRYHTNNESL